ESTEDWPAWQKVAVGALGATSLMSTIALIGAAADDEGDGPDGDGSDTNSGNTVSDSGDGSDSGDSDSGDSNSGDSNSGSSANARKGQGYVEERKDELLVLVTLDDYDGAGSVDSLARDYPVRDSYYHELMAEHPDVIAAANETIEGATLVERLNRLMVVHLFAE